MALIPAPFASSRISSPYGRNHDRYHTGTDFRCGIGTPIYASGPGVVVFSGWNGDRSGWVKTIRYDAVSYAQRPMYCHLNGLGGPGLGDRVNTGDFLAYSGNSGNSTGPHLHVELVSGGDPMKLVFDPNRHVGSGSPAGGGGSKPFPAPETNPKEWDEMATKAEFKEAIQEALGSRPDTVLIHYGVGTRNGIVLAAPGFWHKFTGEQWTQFNAHGLRSGIREITPVNDRDYDVFKEIYSPAPVSISAEQVKAIADATAKQVDVGDVAIDYDRIAGAVRDKFSTSPLK